ncbi:MAG: anti-sigma factor domain-containing protein [Planctomycetota bacterium]|jgi:anti-sigma-K factor RskA
MMPQNERLLELMAQRATEGLDRVASREFEQLAAHEPDTELEAFDYAAAALQLAYLDVEPMPAEVVARIHQPRPARRIWPWVTLVAAMLALTVLLWPRELEGARFPWSPVAEGYAGVSGEVVWDEASQSGFMVLRGLPVNDPKVEQYQLWIVDGREGHYKHPVDGGVFDCPSTGEVRVPINAKLRVEKASTFVLTAEQPGGVVVSDGPFLVVAKR